MFRKSVFSLLVVCLVHASLPGNVYSSSAISASREELRIFELVNERRSRMRLQPLDWDDRLAEVARSYSRQMAREKFFDHYDGRGTTVTHRANRAGIRGWRSIGENLFYCSPASEIASFAVNGWMRSPSHRSNMLDRRWTATGIGMARGSDGHIYVTEIFVEE
jgi:uncharacterized protein YkwD